MFSVFNNKTKITALLIAAFTVIIYLSALNNGFVQWDDNFHVYENPYIKSLDLNFLKWMFSLQETVWIPLTRLSHALTYAVCGLDPMGYHLINIILHGSNTFLVIILVVRLVKSAKLTSSYISENALICGGITGIIFGIHPIHVESVAWVTERKDVLSLFFILLSLLHYMQFAAASVKRQRRIKYLLCLIFFAMALLSKPMAVTLPVILIIFDIYPLERLKLNKALRSQTNILMEKVPFFLLSLSVSLVTIIYFELYEIETIKLDAGLMERLLISVRALFFYPIKMLWPIDLTPIYPYPSNASLFSFEYLAILVLFISVNVFCIYKWKTQKVWAVVWAFYVITLLPVLGVIRYGYYAAAADRYTYLPGLGPSLLISIGIASIYGHISKSKMLRHAKTLFAGLLILTVCLLSILTIKQIKIWESSITLWSAQLEIYPENHLGHMNLATAYGTEGRHDEALETLNSAAEFYPSDPEIYFNRGVTHGKLGAHQKVVEDLKTAISLHPNAHYYNELGVAFGNLGIYDKAIESLSAAIEIEPQLAAPYFYRGIAYKKQGKNNLSLQDFRTAAGLGHERAQTYLNSIGIR